jgi:hypothetical protein
MSPPPQGIDSEELLLGVVHSYTAGCAAAVAVSTATMVVANALRILFMTVIIILLVLIVFVCYYKDSFVPKMSRP